MSIVLICSHPRKFRPETFRHKWNAQYNGRPNDNVMHRKIAIAKINTEAPLCPASMNFKYEIQKYWKSAKCKPAKYKLIQYVPYTLVIFSIQVKPIVLFDDKCLHCKKWVLKQPHRVKITQFSHC